MELIWSSEWFFWLRNRFLTYFSFFSNPALIRHEIFADITSSFSSSVEVALFSPIEFPSSFNWLQTLSNWVFTCALYRWITTIFLYYRSPLISFNLLISFPIKQAFSHISQRHELARISFWYTNCWCLLIKFWKEVKAGLPLLKYSFLLWLYDIFYSIFRTF